MHWIIQENLFHEKGMEELLRVVKAMDLPHTLVKVVPFVGEIIPDVSPAGKVICIGSYSMRHIAKKKGWTPGVYDIGFHADDIHYKWEFFYNKIILRRCTPINNFGDSADTSGYMEVFHDYY